VCEGRVDLRHRLAQYARGGRRPKRPLEKSRDAMIDKIVRNLAGAMQGIANGSTVLMGGFGSVGQPDTLIEGLV